MRSLRRYYDKYEIWAKLRYAMFQPTLATTCIEMVWVLPTSFILNGIRWYLAPEYAYAIVSGYGSVLLKWQSGIKMWRARYVAARNASRIYSRETLMLKLYLWSHNNGLRNELEYISRNDPFD